MERVKVVVRYASGNLIKGSTHDFFPDKETFHLIPVEQNPHGTVKILMKELKAVFIVRDFNGDPHYKELKTFDGNGRAGKKLEIAFLDGEVMVGSTLSFDRRRQGFFIFPVDQKSNNIRVFALFSAIRGLRSL